MTCARCRFLRILEIGAVARKPFSPQSFQKRSPVQRLRFSTSARWKQQRTGNEADDDPAWITVVDREPVIVKMRERHGPGIILLGMTIVSSARAMFALS